MRARRIIDGAAFGPEVIQAASAAFDAAWAEVAGIFADEVHGNVREQLAQAIIAAAREDSRDAGALQRAGLAALARSHPNHLGTHPTVGGKLDSGTS